MIRKHAKTQAGWTSASNALTTIFRLSLGSLNSQSTARLKRFIKPQTTMLLNSTRHHTNLISCRQEYATMTICKTRKTTMSKENKMREKTQHKSFAKCAIKKCAEAAWCLTEKTVTRRSNTTLISWKALIHSKNTMKEARS